LRRQLARESELNVYIERIEDYIRSVCMRGMEQTPHSLIAF